MSYCDIIYEKLLIAHKNAKCELNYNTPFELLVAVILSAQCTDKRVNMATKELFRDYNTPKAFAELEIDTLKKYIFSLGFFNNKAKNLIECAKQLVQKHNGEVPKDFEQLQALSGVGRKTASVVLSVGFNIPAMPVDTHVYRVARRLGLSNANTPEKVEADLKGLFDPSKWNNLHNTMIFQGRYVCKSQKPNCSLCNLKNECKYFKEAKCS